MIKLSSPQREYFADTIEAFNFPVVPYRAQVLHSKEALVISAASTDVSNSERLYHSLRWEAGVLVAKIDYKIVETYCGEEIAKRYRLKWDHHGEVDLLWSGVDYGIEGEEEVVLPVQSVSRSDDLYNHAVADFKEMTPARLDEIVGHMTTLRVMAGLAIN